MAQRLIVIVTAAGVLGGAATGFGGDWLRGEVSGWTLIAHLGFAPLMIFGLAAAAVASGRAHRFDAAGAGGVVGVALRLAFWALLALGLACMGSMLAAMLPFFGYIGQDRLRVVHEISGLGVVIAGVAYLGLTAAAHKAEGSSRHVA